MTESDLYANRRGSKNANAKLTEEDVRKIRELRSGVRRWRKSMDKARTLKAIAELYGVTPCTISHVSRGNHWRHVK